MAKYQSQLKETILEQTNIVDIIQDHVVLQRAGRNHKALCPFHSEKTPSFIVSEDKQRYHCFGCHATGDVITFAMEYLGYDFIDSLEFLAERAGIDVTDYLTSPGNQQQERDLMRLIGLSREAAIFFYKQMTDDAKAYFLKRNLSIETMKKFGLGFAKDQWHELLNYLQSKGYSKEEIEKTGLAIKHEEKGNYYDRFRNRVMFPIFNAKGKVIAFGGRVLDDSLPKYMNSPETVIFNKSKVLYGLNFAKQAIHAEQKVIVVEGYMDVIQLHNAGINNVVATLGTALTAEHGKLLNRYADEVIICYDADQAGQKAALKSVDVLYGIVKHVKVMTLPGTMDPDDFVNEHGIQGFYQEVAKAKWGIDFKLDKILQMYNLNERQGIVDYVDAIRPIIKALTSDIEKSVYLGRIADETGIDITVLSRDVVGYELKGSSQLQVQSEQRQSPLTRSESIEHSFSTVEEQIISLALMGREVYQYLIKSIKMQELQSLTLKSILIGLGECYKTDEILSNDILMSTFDLDLLQLFEGAKRHQQQFGDYSYTIDTLVHKMRIDTIRQRIDMIKQEQKSLSAQPSSEEVMKKRRLLFAEEVGLKKYIEDLERSKK